MQSDSWLIRGMETGACQAASKARNTTYLIVKAD